MKLVAAISQGSGPNNEDGCGFVEQGGEVVAAWVFDGVTGINKHHHLPAATDARWLVQRAHSHLLAHAAQDFALGDLLKILVDGLIHDFVQASRGASPPTDYDPPGACLILAKKYASGWQALRLGDCMIIADGKSHPIPPHAHDDLEDRLKRAAAEMRVRGAVDAQAIHDRFRDDMLASRRSRNTENGLGILVAAPAALNRAEIVDLGTPQHLLLCTDGYYRAVDHYDAYNDVTLMHASMTDNGAAEVLAQIRAIEKSDQDCRIYPRLKASDDATVVALSRQ